MIVAEKREYLVVNEKADNQNVGHISVTRDRFGGISLVVTQHNYDGAGMSIEDAGCLLASLADAIATAREMV